MSKLARRKRPVTMVQVSYPGVYIVEKPSGVHTITGVSTSITAFLGQAFKGPVNKPVRILSFANFEKAFGKPYPDSELSTAVRLFFQNGGSDCYVVRVAKKQSGKQASVILKNQDNSTDILKFVAKEIGTIGNEITVEVDYKTSKPEDSFHIRVFRIDSDGTIIENEEFLNCTMNPDSPRFPPKLVTQNSKLVDCELVYSSLDNYKNDIKARKGYSESRRILDDGNAGIIQLKNILDAVLQTNPGPVRFSVSIDDSPAYQVEISKAEYTGVSTFDELKLLVDPKFSGSNVPPLLRGVIELNRHTFNVGAVSKMVLRIEIKSPSDFKKISILPGSSNDITKALMLGSLEGGVEESSHAFYRPAPNGVIFDLGMDNVNLNMLSGKDQNFFNTITLNGKDIDVSKLITTAATDKWYVAKPPLNPSDGIREKFSILAEEINVNLSKWNAILAGSRLLLKKKEGPPEEVPTVTASILSPPPAPSTPVDISTLFQTNSRLYSLGGPGSPFTGAIELGADAESASATDYIGEEAAHTGLYSLDSVDLFNILVIPDDGVLHQINDARMDLWAPASVYCKKRRAFLLIGAPRQWSTLEPAQILEDPTTGIRSLRRGVVLDYSAVYHPRIVVPEEGLLRTVDPTGAVAGIMARTDATVGVWKAPAGLKADFQGGLFNIETPLSDPENGILNKEGINCLRLFPSGLVCWGARTMDGADDFGSEWKYVPVRRLALFIEESLYRGTKFAVFEPNDEPLWAQLRSSVTTFMRRLFNAQALQGKTEDEAFFVKCDKETTTADDQNLGIVNIIVGFAPLKPAEFVVVTIQQKAGEV